MSNADGKTFKKVPVKFTDAKPIIVEGRTLIPIRAVAEAVGYDVGWDGEKSEVILECDYAVKWDNDTRTVTITADSAK